MIDAQAFGRGLVAIGAQVNRAVEPNTVQAYYVALCDEIDGEEWVTFVRQAVKRWGWQELPTVTTLLDALREFRGMPPLHTEAVAAYDAVLEAFNYTPHGGESWCYRDVAERCGKAAAEAFLAAGGNSAFQAMWKETDRREKFIAHYMREARAEPAMRLLASGKQQQALPPAPTQISPELARELLKKIKEIS